MLVPTPLSDDRATDSSFRQFARDWLVGAVAVSRTGVFQRLARHRADV